MGGIEKDMCNLCNPKSGMDRIGCCNVIGEVFTGMDSHKYCLKKSTL